MLPQMTPRQRIRANKLVRRLCANCVEGECIVLDCECPQMISYTLLCKYFKKAVLPVDKELDESTVLLLDEICRLEDENCTNIYACADAFGKILGNVICHGIDDAGVSRPLYEIGFHIGRWIYLIDAVDDIEKDKKEKSEPKSEAKKAKQKVQEKTAPVLEGEENFKVVHQEAMVVYDEHATSVIPVEETPVVAVEPAKTVVEAVAKPKKARSKKETDSSKKSKEKKSTKKA